ncbi:MAG: hypothetical protein JST30_16155 [Armatimonadetes bacterium]|nr:hypothetical protein [Armatimonadota bacterium]
MSSKKRLKSLLAVALATTAFAQAGTWTPVTNPPTFNPSTMFQLLDGNILVHNEFTTGWYLWKPDQFGSFKNGTFTQVANMHWTRLYYACAVLADGRVIVSGGEYSNAGNWTNKTEYYNPMTNVWTEIAPPAGWSNIGDAPCSMLPDGKFFLANIFDNRTAVLNPASMTWTPTANAPNAQLTEETWITLPEGTVLKWHCVGHPGSAKYRPSSNTWINTGNTPGDMVLPSSFETGPAILMPNGKTFCVGGTNKTNLYTQGANDGSAGTWTAGPTNPNIGGRTIGAEDAPAAMLPNGDVLYVTGPVTSGGGTFETPTYFFEYSMANNTTTQVTSAPNSSGTVPYKGHLLVVPTGELAWCQGIPGMYLYTNGSTFQNAWRPTITSVPTELERGVNYVLNGTQLNGVSNGASYGDEAYPAQNYPLVRVKNANDGRVWYARTFDHSTMGVQTGATPVSTNFILNNATATGAYELEAVAVGIPSLPVKIGVNDSLRIAAFNIIRGSLISGVLSDVHFSDDSYLRVQKGVVANASEAPIQVKFVAASTVSNPTAISVSAETAVNSANLGRYVYLLNKNTGQYDLIGNGAATQTDSTSLDTVTTNASDYVDANGNITAKISFNKTGPVAIAAWQARFDQVHFLVR